VCEMYHAFSSSPARPHVVMLPELRSSRDSLQHHSSTLPPMTNRGAIEVYRRVSRSAFSFKRTFASENNRILIENRQNNSRTATQTDDDIMSTNQTTAASSSSQGRVTATESDLTLQQQQLEDELREVSKHISWRRDLGGVLFCFRNATLCPVGIFSHSKRKTSLPSPTAGQYIV
jgi:hypothetical protein